MLSLALQHDDVMLKDLFASAKSQGFALGAFNLDSLETLKAVTAVAQKLNCPVIVEVSPGELNYLGMRNLASLVDNAKRELGIPIFLNMDHAEDLEVIKKGTNFGFDLIHFDGSKLPLEENIAKAKEVVSWCHPKNILVEGEMDHIPPTNDQLPMTNVQKAQEFVETTGVDIFAVSVGNKHGAGGDEKLDLNLLQRIHDALPNIFFSLHGGSGIAPEEVKAAIKLGVVKVNVNTEMRMAFKTNLDLSDDELAWYKIAENPIAAVQKVVEGKMGIFRSENKT